MAKQYENCLKVGKNLYVREYDTETETSEFKVVNYVPKLWITGEGTKKSFINQQSLQQLNINNLQEYKDALKLYEDTDVRLYGDKSLPFGYIRDNYGDTASNDHKFATFILDIEVGDGNSPHKDSWKPNSGDWACTAVITSIQIYDTKNKDFIILGLKKDWNNKNNFTSEHGDIKYHKMSSEENLLKAFITILNKRNPTMITGWNTEGYDYPYLTGRVARILDNVQDLYLPEYDNKKDMEVLKYNKQVLKCSYVKQLSPLGSVRHREVETNFGSQDIFEWDGIILEDYKNLYHKYTYTSLTSYSLQNVCTHELGAGKVNHDEYSSFDDFYNNDFTKFIEYGITDISLIVDLDIKLKLIDLAKYIAYMCGVTLNDIRGTLKQWQNFIYNESLKRDLILPLTNKFPENDTHFLKQLVNKLQEGSLTLSKERINKFNRLLSDPSLYGQKFIGGWTYASTAYHKWVFSLDFASLYPSAIRWGNIGADTLIDPANLHPDLLEIRAKYFNYYEKDWETPDVSKETARFISEVLRKPEVVEEIRSVLLKHNVCATPNGMFFTKERRAIMPTLIEDIQITRKKHKKKMKEHEHRMETIKNEKIELEEMLKNIQ